MLINKELKQWVGGGGGELHTFQHCSPLTIRLRQAVLLSQAAVAFVVQARSVAWVLLPVEDLRFALDVAQLHRRCIGLGSRKVSTALSCDNSGAESTQQKKVMNSS